MPPLPKEYIIPAIPEPINPDTDDIYIRFFTMMDIRRALRILTIKKLRFTHIDNHNLYRLDVAALPLIENRQIKYFVVSKPNE